MEADQNLIFCMQAEDGPTGLFSNHELFLSLLSRAAQLLERIMSRVVQIQRQPEMAP